MGQLWFPRKFYDADIFRSSDLWTGIRPHSRKTVRDVTAPPLRVGDSAFLLQTKLMKPYTDAVLTPKQHNLTKV